MEFNLRINLDDAALSTDMIPGILEIFKSVSHKLKKEITDGIVYDYNGNVVGNWEITRK